MTASAVTLADLQYALDQSAIVATTDVPGTITYVNEKFCEISKYSRDELLGKNHRLLNSGHHPVEFFREMYRTIGSGHVWRGEIRNRAKDGTFYWVDTTIVPFLDERGKPYQHMAIRYDITDRKRVEALLREQAALSRLGQMAAVVAHELGNPLAGMRGALQIVERRLSALNVPQPIIGEIIGRIDALSGMVRDLLLFSRPRAPQPARLSVATIVRDKVALLASDPQFAKITFETDAEDVAISADRGQIRQVLINLLINAAQAMGGQGRITLSARRSDNRCEITVIDEGPGLSPQAREHLFEPFFTTKHRGTGLGLATARRIVESHGGTLDLKSPPGGGTVATVRLPLDGNKTAS